MSVNILQANALNLPLADGCVQTCVTSPPYWGLRDYGVPGQLGLEAVPDCLGWATGAPCGECYVCRMVAVFREVWRVLRPDGTLFLNLGDSFNSNPTKGGSGTPNGRNNRGEGYARKWRNGAGRADGIVDDRAQRNRNGVSFDGLKEKDLCGIPWRVAFALQADGWYLRSDIIWHKPNPMPESTQDRPTKSHEYIFLLTKSARYYYDSVAVAEPAAYPNDKRRPLGSQGAWQLDGRKRGENGGGKAYDHDTSTRNRRSVWTIATAPYSGAHFATFPPKLVEPCILAGTSERGCCPACGAPWERVVERENNGRTFPGDGLGWDERKADGKGGSGGHVASTTTGWLPTCACPAHEPVPCLVLDPFNGSGTTGRVAVQHRRRYVGTELNQDYIALAHERTGRVQIEMAV